MSAPNAGGTRDADRFPAGPATVPHQKNAAEWVMWAALWPVAWLVRRFRDRGGARHG